jgi:RNA polymerase sigma-70 factor (ECF subfamily)
MPTSRSNQDWLRALSEQPSEAQSDALRDLHEFLVRAVLVYLLEHRGDLSGWSRADVRRLAEDLSQETLLEVRNSLASFRGESKFTTWACRIVINRAASELRRHRYRNVSLDALREEAAGVLKALLAEREAASQVDPEQLVERRRYLDLLRGIIEKDLNDRQRQAIIGVHWEGLSMDDMATKLGLTRNALYKLLHDARKRIKARLLAQHLTEGDILAAFED